MSSLLTALKAQPDSPVMLADPQQIDRSYRYWRWRILLSSLGAYAVFYFVRTNISVPLPAMGRELGYSKAQLGMVLTIGGVTYGISKFANGFLGDRANPRYFMAIGLLLSGLMNIGFGLSSSLAALSALWFFNNWAQGMGFPPCARNLGHWFAPRERSTAFGIWNSGHMIGAALTAVLAGYLVVHLGWRWCFFVPAALTGLGTLFILVMLRDTPGSLGLPPVEVWRGEESDTQLKHETHENLGYWPFVVEYVFKNPFIWILSVANFFVYMLRYTCLDWGPALLQEMKHASPVGSGWLQFAFEMSGMVGGIAAGWITDRYFRGRAGRICTIAMLIMIGAIYLFWLTPGTMPWLAAGLYMVMGLTVYIPQALIAAIAMNLSTKRAGAAAVGLTGVLGYASKVLSGWGVGHLVDASGWDSALKLMLACGVVTVVLMALTWNVGAHPQAQDATAADETDELPVR